MADKAIDKIMVDQPDVVGVWKLENDSPENVLNPWSFPFQVEQMFREIRIYCRQPSLVELQGDPAKKDTVTFATRGQVRQLESFAYAYYLLEDKYGRDYRFVISPLVEDGNTMTFTVAWMAVSPELRDRGTFDGPQADPIRVNRPDPLGVDKYVNMESGLARVAKKLRLEAAKRSKAGI